MELKTLKEWTLWIMKVVLIVYFLSWALNQMPLGRDDTDAKTWGGGRSGMIPVTDALTGCQYLKVPGGGITPRLDAYGRHLGCKL